MKEIIEQLKQEEKKAEKRLANVKLLINLSESAKAIMESFANINEINHDFKQREFNDALNEKLKEKGLFIVGGVTIPKEKIFSEPLLKRRIVSATNEKDCSFIFNGKTHKADLEKGDVVYIEENKVWLKRELKNGVAIISSGDDLFCFQENDKWFYKFELIAE